MAIQEYSGMPPTLCVSDFASLFVSVFVSLMDYSVDFSTGMRCNPSLAQETLQKGNIEADSGATGDAL